MSFVLRLVLGLMVLFASLAVRAAQPADPTMLTITTNGPFSFNLKWKDNATNETGFNIWYRSPPGTGILTLFTQVSANSTNYAFSLIPNVSVGFYVQAFNSNSSSATVPPAGLTATTPSFNSPSNLTVSNINASSAKLTWKDNTAVETSFLVGQSTDGTNFGLAINGSLAPNSTNFTVTGLNPSTKYYFLIEAFFQDAYVSRTADSTNISITTQSLPAPSNLTATVVSPTSVRLGWKDSSSNETSFTVGVRPLGGSGFGIPAGGSLSANMTNFVVTNLVCGTTNDFLVEVASGTAVVDSATVRVVMPGVKGRKFAPVVVGHPFSYVFDATHDYGFPTSFGLVGAIPPGLVFDSAVGQILGTPTQAGLYTPTMLVNYTNIVPSSNALFLRVIESNAAPAIVAPIPSMTLTNGGPATNLALNQFFRDPDAEQAVHLDTTQGAFDVALYSTVTPQTVSNFLGYVNRGDYNTAIFHRAPPGFVVQGGGFKFNGTSIVSIPTVPGPTNEPGIQHLPGTLAMAKVGGDPNSATDQWFVNMGDNSGTLDDQNGGFAAFGRVCGTGMSVFQAIMQLNSATAYVINIDGADFLVNTGNPNQAYNDWPLSIPDPQPPSFDASMLSLVNSATVIEPLTYAVTDDSNPGLVSATIIGTNLTVTPLVSFGGTTALTITATDLDGNTNSQQVNVTVNSPYTGWLTQFGLSGGNAGTAADPDGDGIPNGAEFALVGSPNLADAATIRPTNSLVTVTNLKYLTLSFKLRTNLSGATVSLRGGPVLNPAGWTNVWTSADLIGPQVLQRLSQSNFFQMTVRDSEPVSPTSTNRFLNLRVTTPQ